MWHSDVHGTTPGALYSLLLTEKGDLQLNEMNASVNGAIPTVKKTWWSTGTADKGTYCYYFFIALIFLVCSFFFFFVFVY